jgi:hypothetical protein
VSDRCNGVEVEIVGGPRDGTQGIGIPGVTDKIMWRDGNTGRVLIHEFAGMTTEGKALYRYVGDEPTAPAAPGSQS